MLARRIVIVPYSAEAMFALADNIESYPDFLPWCVGVDAAREGEEV
ncbi:MAG: ubiquinone-binding protein, partial [Betaproteobacteria bacterium]|nr:ubiquinone-binding protein [Betaproteobacteria bacterium]